MRLAFPITAAVSLGAHALVAATLYLPRLLPRSPVDPAPQLSGETFELPAPETMEAPLANASPSPETIAPEGTVGEGDAFARPTPPAHGRHAERPSHAGRPSGGRAQLGTPEGDSAASAAPALYGAVGERSATDLATAFTRGFPQAASADPIWRAAPLGPAGEVDVVLMLDESGHIAGTEVVGAPSPALMSAIRRTLALIDGRPFVAKGRVTKLYLVATITSDAVHDGLHGDVFAVGGSFTGGEGSAFFALAIGRRIDVRVRAK